MTKPDNATILRAGDYMRHIGELLCKIEFTEGREGAKDFDAGIAQVIAELLRIRETKAKVLLIGNGGSASIAGHIEMDLCNRLRVRACTFNRAPLMTALANDFGFGCVFERSISLWADAGDCLIAISSSGQSENILRGVQEARRKQVSVVTFSGFSPDNALRQSGDWNFYVQSRDYGEVEVVHHALGHCLSDLAVAIATQS